MSAQDLVLFSGCGGTTEGLVAAGWNVGACVDYWDKACQAHKRWRPEIPVVQADCKTAHKALRGPFRFVWASPSCKPWSTANRTPKRGKAHPEYYSLAHLARQTFNAWRAKWLVIENVGGLVWSKEGALEVEELRVEVAQLGLKLSMPPRGTIASNTLGVAQLRRRVFLIVGPEYVSIRPGGEWIPPAGVGELLWEAAERASTSAILTDDHPEKSSQGYRHKRTQPPAMACEGSKGSWAVGFARTEPIVEAGETLGRHRTRAEFARAEATIGTDAHPLRSVNKRKHARAERGVVDASLPSRHANWTGAPRAGRGVTASGEDTHSSTDQRSREVNHTGRTLAECCELQHIPAFVVEGFNKRDAHALVGNAVPPPRSRARGAHRA